MKRLGIIGGLGPESTVIYYQRLIAEYRARTATSGAPPVVIDSVEMQRVIDFVAQGQHDALAEYLLGEIKSLAAAGADFALISAVTPHLVFDRLRSGSPVPLLSIIETVRDEAVARSFKTVALFGTGYTMQSQLFPDSFSPVAITVVIPHSQEQDWIHDRYMNELVKGKVAQETRAGLLEIASRMQEESGIEAVILGGTELSLILGDAAMQAAGETSPIPLLDAAQLHVRGAVDLLVS
jgi:aspartate racemase